MKQLRQFGLLAAVASVCFVLAANGSAKTADKDMATAAVERGRMIFQHQCAPCHGQGPGDDGPAQLPGTAALQRKYSGELPAALEKRTDLTADIIRSFVRNGSGAMPMFRKPELSDAAIDDIAAYLKASAASQPAD